MENLLRKPLEDTALPALFSSDSYRSSLNGFDSENAYFSGYGNLKTVTEKGTASSELPSWLQQFPARDFSMAFRDGFGAAQLRPTSNEPGAMVSYHARKGLFLQHAAANI